MTNWNALFSFVLPTKIVFGCGALAQLPAELAALKGSRPLIVTDAGIARCGVLERVAFLLREHNIPYTVFDGVEANPKDRNVAAGAEAYRAFGADSIVAVGGGSPIDCAKAIGVLAANNAGDIKPYEGKTAYSEPLPPLVCVPTTAGTGSELTFSAVITDTANQYKMTVKNAFTAAKTTICDPELTLSVPPMVTAATGVDALTHAIEAFSATCAEPLSDAAALYAIELIYPNLATVVQDGSNIEARSKLLMGSMLAGIAFSHSDVASVHCLAESLGGMFDLPHGMCNAIMLPYVMEYNMDYCAENYARVARAMGVLPDIGREGAKRAVDAIKQLVADIGLPSFASLHVDPACDEAIAEASARNISTGSNPRPMAAADYLAVLRAMRK